MTQIKSTPITIVVNGKQHTHYMDLVHTPAGVVLPQERLNILLSKIGVKHGQAYTVA